MLSGGMSGTQYPAALEAPPNDVTLLSEAGMRQAIEASRQSPRGRIILPFHKSAEASLHRMLNVLQPGTYVRPHRHIDPPKAEGVVLLRGALWFLTFTDDGKPTSAVRLAPGLGTFGVDIEPGVFHTFVVEEADTVMYEVKPGPYTRATDKEFPAWAPAEGEASVAGYQLELDRYVRDLASTPQKSETIA